MEFHGAVPIGVPLQIIDRHTDGFAGPRARVVEEEQERIVSLPQFRAPVRDFQEGIDFFFLQVRDGVLLTPLEGDASDLATPLHMLGASFTNETAQRMDRGESLVAGTNRAT